MEEPRVFIGCASESLQIAEYIQRQVDSVATIHIWNQEVFKAGDYTLERLLKEYTEYDFAIFIIEPVDIADIRGEEAGIARDNVLFEAGLFFGHLGRERTLLVAPTSKGISGPRFHIPSDLTGLTLITYKPYSTPKDLPAKLGPVCTTIKEIIKEKKQLGDLIVDKIIRTGALTGGIIFLLRHLRERTYTTSGSMSGLVNIMLSFNKVIVKKDSPEAKTWQKVTQYGLQTLSALGLAENYGHSECFITPAGEALLDNEKIKKVFKKEMSLPLVGLP